MTASLIAAAPLADQNRSLSQVIARERARLWQFIRRRVSDAGDAEDILQDVLEELVESARVLEPIEQIGAWLFQVARHRIIDVLRRRRTRGVQVALDDTMDAGAADDLPGRVDDLPGTSAGPAQAHQRRVLLDALEAALGDLPPEQRTVFMAHEIEGRSFQELAAQTGLSVNTLLARKRYAVMHLRRRLQAVHDDFSSMEGE